MSNFKTTTMLLIASLILAPLHGRTQTHSPRLSNEALVETGSQFVLAASELADTRAKAGALSKLLEARDSKRGELRRVRSAKTDANQIKIVEETLAGINLAIANLAGRRVAPVYLAELQSRIRELESTIAAAQATLSTHPDADKVALALSRLQELTAIETNLKAQEEAYRALRAEVIDFNRKAPSRKVLSLVAFAAATAAGVWLAKSLLKGSSYPAPDESMIIFGAPLGMAFGAALTIGGIMFSVETFEHIDDKRAEFTALLDAAAAKKVSARATVVAFKRAVVLQLSEQ